MVRHVEFYGERVATASLIFSNSDEPKQQFNLDYFIGDVFVEFGFQLHGLRNLNHRTNHVGRFFN